MVTKNAARRKTMFYIRFFQFRRFEAFKRSRAGTLDYIAQGPYSNPSDPGANDISILVHYCTSGSTISAQVYDNMGNPIGLPTTYVSDGQEWDRVPVNPAGSSGTFYITVSVGAYQQTLNYAVY